MTAKLAEHYSVLGRFSEAKRILAGFGTPQSEWPPELWAAHGMVLRRRQQPFTAVEALQRAAATFRSQGNTVDLIRVLMHAAAAALSAKDPDLAVELLKEALFDMLRLKLHATFQPDFDELRELIHYALLEPDTAPLLEPVLDSLAYLAGSPRLPEDSYMRVQVSTLGRASVFKDGTEVPLVRKGSTLLLAYLCLYPGRTRAEIRLSLYPDQDEDTGCGYIRSAIVELRALMGREVMAFADSKHGPTYRLGDMVHCELDLVAFREAAARGEAARMMALYRGDFLPGISESEWVKQIRDETLKILTFELRVQITRFEAVEDWRRVILLANQYLRVDPSNLEVLELRVWAAKIIGSPEEVARYTAQLKRTCN